MSYQIQFYAEVKLDVLSAKKWYKKQQSGLEKRFSEEVKKAIGKLQTDPLLYEVRYRDIRIKHLDIFPFGIHFKIETKSNLVIIIGILHHRQHLESFYNR